MTVSEIFQAFTLGTGCYIIRNDEDCGLPDAAATILDAVIAAGACSVVHSGMYDAIRSERRRCPGGCIYEMVGEYGFGGLPERSWVIGARPLRHIMRLLDLSQPRRRLSGTPSRIPVGYPQGWPAGVARWKVIGQVPTRMVMLEVSELLAESARPSGCARCIRTHNPTAPGSPSSAQGADGAP